MMNTVNSFSNNEDLFGSTFAEPEAYFRRGVGRRVDRRLDDTEQLASAKVFTSGSA